MAEVREALGEDVGYTTVLKMLQILEEKGAVGHEQEGRAYRYFPLVESVRAGGRALSRIVNKIFHGSAEMLLATLVEGREFTEEELRRMRAVLDRVEGRGEGGVNGCAGNESTRTEAETMSEKRRKLAAGHTVVLMGVAIGALVVACDAPVPTELRETVDEVVADEAGDGTVPVPANRPAQSPLAKWFDSEAAPLVFVDDVRIENPEGLPEAVRRWIEGGLDDDLARRVKVVRTTQARELYGEEGGNGAILIFTGQDGADAGWRRCSAPLPRTPWPLVVVDGQRVRLPAVPSNLPPYQFGCAVWGALLMSHDIESFEIFRDAAVAAYYGDESASSVIQIVTKQPGSAR